MPLNASLVAALAGGSIIDIDGTLFVQLAIFFMTFFVLKALVFGPMMKLFEAREKAIDGAREEAKALDKDAKAKGTAFDDELRKVKLAAQEERDRLRADGAHLERQLLEHARKETQSLLTDAAAKLTSERARARGELERQVPVIAKQIATRVLGREVV